MTLITFVSVIKSRYALNEPGRRFTCPLNRDQAAEYRTKVVCGKDARQDGPALGKGRNSHHNVYLVTVFNLNVNHCQKIVS